MTPNELVAIIPSYNEEKYILEEIELLKQAGLDKIIVALDQGNTDNTEVILNENRIYYVTALGRGYDITMNAGVLAIKELYPNCKYVLFTSTGKKYNYQELSAFYQEIDQGSQMVMGRRDKEDTNLLWHQKLGTNLVLFFINLIFGTKFQDIGPLRIIHYDLLLKLNMEPAAFRWTTEMLVKCLALGANVTEVSVSSYSRLGKSKITGKISNSIKAGIDMISALKFYNYRDGQT